MPLQSDLAIRTPAGIGLVAVKPRNPLGVRENSALAQTKVTVFFKVNSVIKQLSWPDGFPLAWKGQKRKI